MVELIMVIVILGILAAVAIPRMDTSGYRALEFHDKTVAALRYAQKTAVSHRRMVCVSFPNNASMELKIALSAGAACSTALPLPGSSSNLVVSGDATNAVFTSGNVDFSFNADGTGVGATLQIMGQPDIQVVGATGYVQ